MRLPLFAVSLISLIVIGPSTVGAAIAETNRFTERSLRIGFDVDSLPDISRSDLEVSLKFWSEEISEQTKIPITTTFYHQQIPEMVKDFETGVVNYLFTSPIRFVQYVNRDILADGFTTAKTEQRFDSLALLTRRHESMDSVRQLRRRNVTLLAHNELQQLYLGLLSLQAFGEDYRVSFNMTTLENNSQRLILQLFFKKTDAVMVNEASFNLAAELNPQLTQSLQVVAKLEDVPQNVGFFHKAVAEDFREDIIGKALNIQEYRRGRDILEVFKTQRMVRSAPSDLENVLRLYQEYKAVKNRHGRF